MTTKTLAMLHSFGRFLAATTGAAYLTLGKQPLDLELADLRALLNATIAAAVLTGVNYYRSGETRFGRDSKDLGMGGEDVLEVPSGQINPASLVNLTPDSDEANQAQEAQATYLGTARARELEQPVQTDNRPRAEDGEQLPEFAAEWSGTEMR